MTKLIDFYFDFISPYSYLAHKQIETITKKKKINFNYKPVLVGGLHNLLGITAPAFIKPKLKHMINDCSLIAKKNNFNFIWNSRFPLSSLDIMRGYLFVNSDIKNLFMNLTFDAYWKDNLDISNEKILSSLLKKSNINRDAFYRGIKSSKIKEELKRVTHVAYKKEIFGTPTFVVNGKIFWGQDRLEFALDEYNK